MLFFRCTHTLWLFLRDSFGRESIEFEPWKKPKASFQYCSHLVIIVCCLVALPPLPSGGADVEKSDPSSPPERPTMREPVPPPVSRNRSSNTRGSTGKLVSKWVRPFSATQHSRYPTIPEPVRSKWWMDGLLELRLRLTSRICICRMSLSVCEVS